MAGSVDASRSGRFRTAVASGAVVVALTVTGCASDHHRQPAAPSSAPAPRARTLAALPRGTVVAFLGDSYTQGQGATTPTRRWSSVLCAEHGWVEQNFGSPGSGFLAGQPYAARVPTLAASHPDVVIVAGGINDLPVTAYSPPAEDGAIVTTFGGLRQVLPHAVLVALRPFYPNAAPPASLATIGSDEASAVTAVGGVYVDLGTPLRGQPQDIAADALHPNDAGHAALARAVDQSLHTVHVPVR